MTGVTERPQIVICRLLAYERLDPTSFPLICRARDVAQLLVPLIISFM
jgi:hypothetical protein